MTTLARARYVDYRFPAEIIGDAVWLYFGFPLGLRMVEGLLAASASSSAMKPYDSGRANSTSFANQIRRPNDGGRSTVDYLARC